MQVKSKDVKNENEKRNILKTMAELSCEGMYLGGTILICFILWNECLRSETEIWRIIATGICLLILFGIAMGYLLYEYVKTRIKPCYFYITIIGIQTVLMLVVPIVLQGVYRATKDNIIITENTQSVSEKIIYFTDESTVIQQISGVTENDIIVVTFEENIRPYVEILQYCTEVTTDNQNPWGRKYTETSKEWRQYEFHLPASETNN